MTVECLKKPWETIRVSESSFTLPLNPNSVLFVGGQPNIHLAVLISGGVLFIKISCLLTQDITK